MRSRPMSTSLVAANSPCFPAGCPGGLSIPQTLRTLTHLVRMNDMQRLEDTFRKHGDSMAAMLIEPIQGNCCGIAARADHVRLARDPCDRYGVLLIIDEVKTGFRVGRSGVQGLRGVTPDISTFAKAMANGYRIAAIGGREEVMRSFAFGKAAHGGKTRRHRGDDFGHVRLRISRLIGRAEIDKDMFVRQDHPQVLPAQRSEGRVEAQTSVVVACSWRRVIAVVCGVVHGRNPGRPPAAGQI